VRLSDRLTSSGVSPEAASIQSLFTSAASLFIPHGMTVGLVHSQIRTLLRNQTVYYGFAARVC
jgi:hypothetical protein